MPLGLRLRLWAVDTLHDEGWLERIDDRDAPHLMIPGPSETLKRVVSLARGNSEALAVGP